MTMTPSDRRAIVDDLLARLKDPNDPDRQQMLAQLTKDLKERYDWENAFSVGVPEPGDDPYRASALGGYAVRKNVPLGVELDLRYGPTEMSFIVFPRTGVFYVHGVRSFNGPYEVEVIRVQHGNGTDLVPSSFDSASYSLTHGAFSDADVHRHLAYYRADWGAISRANPLLINLKPWGTPAVGPVFAWTLYGEWLDKPDDAPTKAEVEPNDA